MYPNTPMVAAPAGIGSSVVAERVASRLLPNTGAPIFLSLLVLAVALIVTGAMLLRGPSARTGGARRRWIGVLVAAAATALMAVLVAGAVADGELESVWGGVGLVVGLFTLGYLALAVRNLLPAGSRAVN